MFLTQHLEIAWIITSPALARNDVIDPQFFGASAKHASAFIAIEYGSNNGPRYWATTSATEVLGTDTKYR